MKNVLRWVALLPVSILGAWVSYFLLRIIITIGFKIASPVFFYSQDSTNTEWIDRIGRYVSEFFAMNGAVCAFMAIAILIAPCYKKQVKILSAIAIILYVGINFGLIWAGVLDGDNDYYLVIVSLTTTLLASLYYTFTLDIEKMIEK